MKTIVFVLTFLPLLAVAQTPTRFKPLYVNITELGVLFGQVRHGTQAFETVSKRTDLTAQSFNGIQLNPKLAVGATVGADWYSTTLITPLCAGIRFDFARPNQKNLRVFSALDTGWGFTWFQEDATGWKTSGGWLISPGVGLRIGKPTNTNFILTLSYKRQEASAEKPLGWNELAKHETRVYNRVAIRMGVCF